MQYCRTTKIVISSTDTNVSVLLWHYFESLQIKPYKNQTCLKLTIKQNTFLFILWYRTLANLELQAY